VNTSLVTGGLRGIGLAIVEKLHDRGDSVFVFDCIDPSHNSVKYLLSKNIWYYQVDIGLTKSIDTGFLALKEELLLKDLSLNILINNAGITRDTISIRLKEKDWNDVLDINLRGAFFCAKNAIREMIKRSNSHRGGYIVNVSSVVGIVGNPGQVNYAASKAGLIAVTKTLAKEYASKNILVNAVAPGFIQTQMTEKLRENIKLQAKEQIPLGRLGTSEDIAKVVEFLTNGSADYITGQVINIDGGMVI
jgi:3-oxoacyl-[acyl-carrier protein] reductase